MSTVARVSDWSDVNTRMKTAREVSELLSFSNFKALPFQTQQHRLGMTDTFFGATLALEVFQMPWNPHKHRGSAGQHLRRIYLPCLPRRIDVDSLRGVALDIPFSACLLM